MTALPCEVWKSHFATLLVRASDNIRLSLSKTDPNCHSVAEIVSDQLIRLNTAKHLGLESGFVDVALFISQFLSKIFIVISQLQPVYETFCILQGSVVTFFQVRWTNSQHRLSGPHNFNFSMGRPFPGRFGDRIGVLSRAN